MGIIEKILLSFFFIMVLIAGTESIKGDPKMNTGERYPQKLNMTTLHEAQTNLGPISPAYGADGGAADALGAGNGEDIDGKPYASFSPHVDMISRMTPSSAAINGDLALAFEQRRSRWHEKDSMFFGDDRKAILEPEAIGVLGFGLIGLFVIVRLRFRK